jgi:hypothetical protein
VEIIKSGVLNRLSGAGSFGKKTGLHAGNMKFSARNEE